MQAVEEQPVGVPPENPLKKPKPKNSEAHSAFVRLYILMASLGALFSMGAWALVRYASLSFLPSLFSPLSFAVGCLVVAMTALTLFVRFLWPSYRKWLEKMDWYPGTGPFALGWGMAILPLFVLSYGSVGLLVPALFFSPFLFKNIISGSTYLARLRDFFKDNKKYAFLLLLAGVLLSLGYMVLRVHIDGHVAHIDRLHFLAWGIAAVGYISTFAGLIYRFYSSQIVPVLKQWIDSVRRRMSSFFNEHYAHVSDVDPNAVESVPGKDGAPNINREKTPFEQKWLRYAGVFSAIVAVGLVIARVFFASDFISAIAATGLITEEIGKSWSLFFLFVPSFVGASMSTTDYICKFFVYLRGLLGESEYVQYLNGNRRGEYAGAFIGTIIGVALSVPLIVSMVLWPDLFPALLTAAGPLGIAGLALMLTGVGGNVGGKLGKTFDGASKVDENEGPVGVGYGVLNIPNAPPLPSIPEIRAQVQSAELVTEASLVTARASLKSATSVAPAAAFHKNVSPVSQSTFKMQPQPSVCAVS